MSTIHILESLDTKSLMMRIINLPFNEAFKFAVPRNEGKAVMSRVRSEIARQRGILKRSGKDLRKFRIYSPISDHPETAKLEVITVILHRTKSDEIFEQVRSVLKEGQS